MQTEISSHVPGVKRSCTLPTEHLGPQAPSTSCTWPVQTYNNATHEQRHSMDGYTCQYWSTLMIVFSYVCIIYDSSRLNTDDACSRVLQPSLSGRSILVLSLPEVAPESWRTKYLDYVAFISRFPSHVFWRIGQKRGAGCMGSTIKWRVLLAYATTRRLDLVRSEDTRTLKY